MLSFIILYALLFVVSVFLCAGSGLQNIPDTGLFDYLNLLFFNTEKFAVYGMDWNLMNAMHFFLLLFFGIFYCSASARDYRKGMNQMELIRYGSYGKYFLSCNLKNALNVLQYMAAIVLLPLSVLFIDQNVFTKFNSLTGVPAAENTFNISIFFMKIFAFFMLLELILLVLIRRRDYSFSLAVTTASAGFAMFADSVLKTGFITLGNPKNQLIAVGVYVTVFAALYPVLRREPRSM